MAELRQVLDETASNPAEKVMPEMSGMPAVPTMLGTLMSMIVAKIQGSTMEHRLKLHAVGGSTNGWRH